MEINHITNYIANHISPSGAMTFMINSIEKDDDGSAILRLKSKPSCWVKVDKHYMSAYDPQPNDYYIRLPNGRDTWLSAEAFGLGSDKGVKMKQTTIEYEVALNGALRAAVKIERVGQQDPCDGDGVIVRTTIILPTCAQSNELHRALAFEDRVYVLDMPLQSNWGWLVNGSRQESTKLTGSSWPKLFEEAKVRANETLKPLIEALSKRRQAFIDAEKD